MGAILGTMKSTILGATSGINVTPTSKGPHRVKNWSCYVYYSIFHCGNAGGFYGAHGAHGAMVGPMHGPHGAQAGPKPDPNWAQTGPKPGPSRALVFLAIPATVPIPVLDPAGGYDGKLCWGFSG